MKKQLNVPQREIESGATFYVDNDKYSTGSVKQVTVKRYTNGIIETKAGDLYHDFELFGSIAEAESSRNKKVVLPRVVVNKNGGFIEAVLSDIECKVTVIDEDNLRHEGESEGTIMVQLDDATNGLEVYYQ